MRNCLAVMGCLLACVVLAACDSNDDSSSGGNPAATLAIVATSLPAMTFNSEINIDFQAINGVAPYRWELAGGALPGFVEVTAAGELYGNSLDDSGDFAFTVLVRDSTGATATRDFTLTVAAAPPPPYYIGEPAISYHVFVVDASADAGTIDAGQTQSRLEISLNHLAGLMAGLNPPLGKFDIVVYGDGVRSCFGSLQYSTTGNLAIAAAFVAGLAPQGESAMYSALQAAFVNYPYVDTIHFYAAGQPGQDAGAPGGTATPTNILSDAPAWIVQQPDAGLFVYDADGSGAVTSFLQQLASLAGGSYSTLP